MIGVYKLNIYYKTPDNNAQKSVTAILQAGLLYMTGL